MVCVCVGEYSTGHGFDGDVVLDLDGHSEVSNGVLFPLGALVCDRVEVTVPSESLGDLP